MLNRYILVLGAILMILSSCEEEVQLNTSFQKKGVVQTLIAPNRLLTTILSYDHPPLSSAPIEYIDNADVRITNIEESFYTDLVYKEAQGLASLYSPSVPHYSSQDSISPTYAEGDYQIEIDIPGKEPLKGYTSIPKKIPFDNLRSTRFVNTSTIGENVYNFDVIFDFEHTMGQKYQVSFLFLYFGIPDTALYASTSYFTHIETNIPYTVGVGNELLIDGTDLPDQNVSIKTDHSVFYNPSLSEFYPIVLVELRNLSDEYFAHNYSLARLSNQGDSVLTTPIVVPSNIENGLGIFGGYNYDSQGLILEF